MIKWLKENSIIFCILIALCVIALSVAIITNGKKNEEFLITNEEGDRTIWNDFSLLSFSYYENVSQNKINRKASIYETGKEKVLSIKEADSIDEAKEELGLFQNEFSINEKEKGNMFSYEISSTNSSKEKKLITIESTKNQTVISLYKTDKTKLDNKKIPFPSSQNSIQLVSYNQENEFLNMVFLLNAKPKKDNKNQTELSLLSLVTVPEKGTLKQADIISFTLDKNIGEDRFLSYGADIIRKNDTLFCMADYINTQSNGCTNKIKVFDCKNSSLLYSCDLELNTRKYQNSIMEGSDIENINCFCDLSAGGKLGKNIFSKHIFPEE